MNQGIVRVRTTEKVKELKVIKQSNPTVKESTLRNKLDIPQVLTHRTKRMAKKAFKKHKQIPHGYELLYRMGTSIDANPIPSENLKGEWAYLDSRSMEMFKKKYDKLSKQQKSRLIDTLHKED